MPEKASATTVEGALEPQVRSEAVQAGAAPTAYAILARRFADLLAQHEQAIAAAMEREFFGGEPPACVSGEWIMRGMLARLQRSTDTLVASDMAYHAALRSRGRLGPDAPSISPDIAYRVALAADLERQTHSGIERWREMDRWVYPKGVPEVARTADWVAGFRLFAEQIASHLEGEADQEPFVLLDGLAGIMKWIARVLELSELSAACGEIEREGAALPPPPPGAPPRD